MSRSVIAVLLGLLAACGNSSGGGTDAGGGDDQMGDGGGGGNTPHTIKLTLTNRPMNADTFSFLVAYQDGASGWTLAPAPSGDTYSFSINAPSYGVAFTCITPASSGTTATPARLVTAAYFAVGERTELTLAVPERCTDRGAQGVMLNGSVTNRPVTGTLAVAWGGKTALVGGQTGNFQLSAAPGTHDLFVIHAAPEGNGDFYTDEMWVARGVTLSSNGTRTIDFSQAQQTSIYYDDMSNADPGARITATTMLYSANGSSGLLVRDNANWGSVALADAQMETTDVYDQAIQVAVTGKSATITHATNEPADQAWDPPQAFGAVQSGVVAKMPYLELQAAWPAYGNAVGYQWTASQTLSGTQCGGNNNASCVVSWQAYLSPGVTGAMPAFVMPDLASLAGWKSALQFAPGSTPVVGSVTAQTSSAGAGDFPPGVPANGTDRSFVRSDFVTSVQ